MIVPPVCSPTVPAQRVLVRTGGWGGEIFLLCFGGMLPPKPKKRLSKQGFSLRYLTMLREVMKKRKEQYAVSHPVYLRVLVGVAAFGEQSLCKR